MTHADDLPDDLRLVLVHKQRTSARVRFLRFAHGMLAFAPLPRLSALLESVPPSRLETHPGLYLRQAEARLGLAPGDLAHEAGYCAAVDTPDGTLRVRLASFTGMDPPFAAAARVNGRFVAITEARGTTSVELELLRLAYSVLLG
jgi:hypothetical protein